MCFTRLGYGEVVAYENDVIFGYIVRSTIYNYSRTPPYEHPVNAGTSLLRTVFSTPAETGLKKPPLIRTVVPVQMVSVIMGFDCTYKWDCLVILNRYNLKSRITIIMDVRISPKI